MVIPRDHLHAIWTLPPGDADYSKRWGAIKKHFTESWLALGGADRQVLAFGKECAYDAHRRYSMKTSAHTQVR